MPPRWSFSCQFYISHPADSRYNAINTRFWLQYHTLSELQSPLSTTDTHLIWPPDTSQDYATRHKLLPFRKWVNLTHHNTFIHGPFDFATVNGRKTRDRISQPDWDVLKTHCNMFHNPLPRFDVPSYSIHVDHGAHVTFHCDAIARQLIISAPNANDTPGALKSPWQKVTASRAHHPPPHFFIYPIMKVPHLRYDMLKRTHWKSALPESQRSVRVWNIMRNLWHFCSQF